MEIDNFNKILSMISWDDPDKFYFLQIIKRRKDNPALPRDMKLIDTFLIGSKKEYTSKIPAIKEIARLNNARVYFWLNTRSYKVCALKMITAIAVRLEAGEHKSINSLYYSICGKNYIDKDKKWIIDLDGEFAKEPLISGIVELIISLQKKTKKESYIETIPTFNGVHLIARPFNLSEFKTHEITKGIDVHKNGPTLAYFNPVL
jgi:hypothetical protein